jgi:hypothetical protein
MVEEGSCEDEVEHGVSELEEEVVGLGEGGGYGGGVGEDLFVEGRWEGRKRWENWVGKGDCHFYGKVRNESVREYIIVI